MPHLATSKMASLLNHDGDHVLVTCSCSTLSPLTRLYFCRHCIKLRCQLCVSHEVDSYYCPNCLENMPSAEAKLKRNRCANCFDCPSCSNTLSTRATAVAIQSEDSKATQARKVYYLACGFCRWSSRDVGIADRSVASGGWQEQENTATKRVGTLVEFYRQLAEKEKVEREKKKLTKRRSYMHLAFKAPKKDRCGISSLNRRKSSLSYLSASLCGKGKEMEDINIVLKDPSEATEEVETLPEEYYTKPLVLEKTPQISQRLANPDFQPGDISSLYPRHKHLLAKRSQRCRECEHNLSKPEFNPSSIKFKIQLGAVHYVPRLRIADVPLLECEKEVPVTLSMTNPVENIVKVTLLQIEEENDDKVKDNENQEKEKEPENNLEEKENDKNKENQKLTKESEKIEEKDEKGNNENKDKKNTKPDDKESSEKSDKEKEEKGKGKDGHAGTGMLDRKTDRRVDNRCDSKAFISTAEVVLPTFPLALAARDEAAEFDDADTTAEMFSDDPRFVADRQANKLWFFIKIIPKKPTGDVKFSMIMQYDYKHTSTALVRGSQETEEHIETLQHNIHVNLGPVDGATEV